MTTTENLTINRLLNTLAERGATDAHFIVGNNPYLRIDGQLVPLSEEEVINPEFLDSLISFFVPEEKQKALKENKELKFIFNWLDKARFRVHLYQQKGYFSLALKLIPQQIKSIEELGLPKVVSTFSQASKGLIIISGPFNSGRSSTLAGLIEAINKNRPARILYLEEPIERLFVNQKGIIEQREVGIDVVSFTQGLRSIKDENVDVVAIDRVDNVEAMELLLELSESGRLVLAVMNYDSAISCLEGIVSDFPEAKKQWAQDVLADYLVGIIVQRLLPAVQGGLALATEILIASSSAKALIKDGRFANLESIIQTSRAEGMVSLDFALAELVKTGRVSQEEALKQANNPKNLSASLKK